MADSQQLFNLGYNIKCLGSSLHMMLDKIELDIGELDPNESAELITGFLEMVRGGRALANGAEGSGAGLIRASGLNHYFPKRPNRDGPHWAGDDDDDATEDRP